MEATQPIRIMLVEDSQDDAKILEHHLRGQNLDFVLERVEELEALEERLRQAEWDILLSDYHLPTTDGLSVVKEVKRLAPVLPCIVLSGWIDEAAAVEALRAGAKDVIGKGNLARLVPAILREVANAREYGRAMALQPELDETIRRLSAIVENTLDGIVMMDDQGRISVWNPSAERIFGYSNAEALGKDLHRLLAPDRYQERFEKAFERYRVSGRGKAIGKVVELSGRRKDGTEFPLELTIAPLEIGNTWHAVGILRDITERKALERQQLESLQFLRTLVETIPSPLYYQDPAGRIEGCNQAMQAFFGLSCDRLKGTTIAEYLPAGVARRSAVVDQALLDQPGVREFSARLESESAGAREVIFRRASYCHADGEVAGIVGTIQDITELKAAEKALRKTEALFTIIHRHVVDLIAIIDASGRRIYSSPSYQFVLGYEAAEMSEMGATDLLHPEDRERVETALRGLVLGRPTQNLEYRLRHKDGRWLHFESTAALILGREDGAIQALIVARDVTSRKEEERQRAAMEVQLRQAQKLEAIGQLAAGIAHEINTPTQYIGDNMTFLRDAFQEAFPPVGRLLDHLRAARGAGGPAGEAAERALAELAEADLDYLREEIPKAIQQSLDGVTRISKIVSAMKDFSHPGGDAKTRTDLHHLIESAITVSRNVWKYAATLETEFDPTLPPVPCFPDEFNQIVLNLIVNAAHAIEASGKGAGELGRITVKTVKRDREVELSVSDDGVGIPGEIRSRIFEPFFTTKAVGRGTGQGLAIVHAVVVEKHRGRILLESEPGQGSTFRIFLPLDGDGDGQ